MIEVCFCEKAHFYFTPPPILVFNKADLGDFDSLPETYRAVGYKAFVVSAETGKFFTPSTSEGMLLLPSAIACSSLVCLLTYF